MKKWWSALVLVAVSLPAFGNPLNIDPSVQFDVVAIEVKSVKQPGSSAAPAMIEYKVLSTLRQHPNPNLRTPAQSKAVFAPIMDGSCGTGHHYPAPPPEGSRIYVLSEKNLYGFDTSISDLVPVATTELPPTSTTAAFPAYPEDEPKVREFIKSKAVARQEWEATQK